MREFKVGDLVMVLIDGANHAQVRKGDIFRIIKVERASVITKSIRPVTGYEPRWAFTNDNVSLIKDLTKLEKIIYGV